MASASCVQDEGLYSHVPNSPVSIKLFVEAYHRLGGNLDVLKKGFSLEPAQLYAAMAFYHTNQEMFDAATEQFWESQRSVRYDLLVSDEIKNSWWQAPWSGRNEEATDKEVEAALEHMS